MPSASAAPPDPKLSDGAGGLLGMAKALDDAQIAKIHSAVRWDKPQGEIEEVIRQVVLAIGRRPGGSSWSS